MSYDLNKWVQNEQSTVKRRPYLPWGLGMMMAMVAAIAILEVLDEGPDEATVASVGPMVLLIVVAGSSSPFAAEALGWGSQRRTDEFLETVLARATARAFGVLLVLVMAAFTWFWLASLNGWPRPQSPMDWSAIGLAFLGIGAALPTMLAEMMVPLPPKGAAEEEEE